MFILFDQNFFISDTSKFESFQMCSYLVSGAVLCFFLEMNLEEIFPDGQVRFRTERAQNWYIRAWRGWREFGCNRVRVSYIYEATS
jgi:hypothetical protein